MKTGTHSSRLREHHERRRNCCRNTERIRPDRKAPAGNEPNWVPTDPARKFELMVRFYAPTKALFEKAWKLPDVEKVK